MTDRRKKTELRIVFDTNVIYTQAANDLLKPDIVDLIKSHSSHDDISITWHLPEIVVHERKYQMIQRAMDLLPNLEKLEKLLGHKLGITPDILETRVDEAVRAHLKANNINIIQIDTGVVDWDAIILAAAYRQPPFERGDKEKGFRDAIVVESLLQLVEKSPVTPKICRIALVTEDKLLQEALKDKISGRQNVRIMTGIEDIKDLINTLTSEINEEDLLKIKTVVGPYFFVSSEKKDTFYYTENIRENIRGNYVNKLNELPDGTEIRENGTWYVGPPSFTKKDERKLYWVNRIEVEYKAYIKEVVKTFTPAGLAQIEPQEDKSSKSPLAVNLGLLRSLQIPTPTQKKLVKVGRTIFDVYWSVLVSPKLKLSKSKLEEIKYVETTSEDAEP